MHKLLNTFSVHNHIKLSFLAHFQGWLSPLAQLCSDYPDSVHSASARLHKIFKGVFSIAPSMLSYI